jgi:tellurite methyltransferase
MPRNWDEHYSDPSNLDFTPAPMLVEAAELLTPGRALDLACGAGRNSLYLASLGWHVLAVDSSPVAIRLLRDRARGLDVDARVTDLETGGFQIEPAAYDLICDFFYLQRDLFPQIREGVRPGGTFAGAIHLLDSSPEASSRNPAFLLRPEELRAEFAGWKILFYSEAREPERGRPTARIIARRA